MAVSTAAERMGEVVRNDLETEFLRSLCLGVPWEYQHLHEDLAADPALTDDLRAEEFARRRSNCAVRAMIRAAQKHGVPYDLRRLPCNGQTKLLLKIGRVVLIQEPIISVYDEPKASDYKRELAASGSIIQQLELDLGDQPNRVLDWSGSVLAVLLHGCAGPRFTREHKMLGGLMLAVPDAHYMQWVLRLNLRELALFGRGNPEQLSHEDVRVIQQDKVTVKLKKKARGTAA
jgi:hypothetical protein